MMTSLIGLAWIWWAICGFVAVFVGFWAFGSMVYQPPEMNVKHRNRWLRQHFGEEGMKRWNENMRRSNLCRDFWDKHRGLTPEHNRLYREFENAKLGGYIHRTDDGRAEGFVQLPLCDYAGRFGGDVPWGDDRRPYLDKHGKKITTFHRSYDKGLEHHGEPRVVDWMAAGFWDPVRRADDGVLIDLRDLMYSEEWVATRNGVLAHFPIPVPKDIAKKALADVNKYERDNKLKSNRGLRGIG